MGQRMNGSRSTADFPRPCSSLPSFAEAEGQWSRWTRSFLCLLGHGEKTRQNLPSKRQMFQTNGKPPAPTLVPVTERRDVLCSASVHGTMAMPVTGNPVWSAWRRSQVTCEVPAMGLHSHIWLHVQLTWTPCWVKTQCGSF